MGFMYHGDDSDLKAIDNALQNYQNKSNYVEDARVKEKILSTIKNINYLMTNPQASTHPFKTKIKNLSSELSALVETAPVAHVPGITLIHNVGDIRKSSDYWVLVQVGNHYKLQSPSSTTSSLGECPPADGAFVFVIVASQPDEVRVGRRHQGGHTAISRGESVYFAGELELQEGKILYWNNDTGHYQSPSSLHTQATHLLPKDKYIQKDFL